VGDLEREQQPLRSGDARPTTTAADQTLLLCLVCSTGGHLYQLYRLKNWWVRHRRFWVTFKKADAESLLDEEEVHWAAHPTTRNVRNLLLNTILAFRILIRRRPDLVVSDGAGVAVPFFYVAKILGIPTLYLEVYDRIELPTLTGRLVYPVADCFALQWDEQRRFYPRGVVVGTVL
jgi:beta-1,4-N-acetylglucosaminyltransferase